jgi:hypothetical protein
LERRRDHYQRPGGCDNPTVIRPGRTARISAVAPRKGPGAMNATHLTVLILPILMHIAAFALIFAAVHRYFERARQTSVNIQSSIGRKWRLDPQ